MIIGDGLRRTAKVYPEKVAIIDKFGKYCPVDTRYTYREVVDRVNRLSNSLLSLGLQKGDRVALLTATRMGFYLSQLAIMNAGLVFAPVNAVFGGKSSEFIHLINDSGAKALIVDADIYKNEVQGIESELPVVKYLIGLGENHGCPCDLEALIENGSPHEPKVRVTDDDLALLQYTSGTTGLPKGTMLTHKNLSISAYLWSAELRVLPHYNFLLSIPSATSGAIGLQNLCVFRGMTLVLSDFDPPKILRIIQDEKINTTMFAPPMTARLVRHPDAGNYDYSSLKSIITSAAPISAELLKEASSVFGDVYIELFGTTETCLLGAFLQPEERAMEGPLSKRLTSVGKACLGYMIKVIDENGNEVKTGEIGELLISGDAVAAGYWNMPDTPDFKDGWWHSGDLALVDEDEYIHIVDRKKDMILSGGENIYPREVEDIIATHPGVFLVSVIGVPDEQWGESVKAVIVPSEDAEITEEEIIDYCKARLSSYKKPRSVDFVDISDMPLMAGGYKVIKRELRDKYRKKFMEKTGKKIDRWGTI